jgi:hypothetical protein
LSDSCVIELVGVYVRAWVTGVGLARPCMPVPV